MKKNNTVNRLIKNAMVLLVSGIVLIQCLYCAINNVNSILEEKKKNYNCEILYEQETSSSSTERKKESFSHVAPVLLSLGVPVTLCTIALLLIAYLAFLFLKKAYAEVEDIFFKFINE